MIIFLVIVLVLGAVWFGLCAGEVEVSGSSWAVVGVMGLYVLASLVCLAGAVWLGALR